MKYFILILLPFVFLTACNNETGVTEIPENDTANIEENETNTTIETTDIESEEKIISEEDEVESEEDILEEENEKVKEVIEEPEEETMISDRESITTAEIQQLVQDFIGFEDEVNEFEVTGGDIYLSLVMATDELFTPEDLAVNRYSQVSDELLYYEGWETLTINFMGIGTISMNYSEAELNEYGYFFPTMNIEENLLY